MISKSVFFKSKISIILSPIIIKFRRKKKSIKINIFDNKNSDIIVILNTISSNSQKIQSNRKKYQRNNKLIIKFLKKQYKTKKP